MVNAGRWIIRTLLVAVVSSLYAPSATAQRSFSMIAQAGGGWGHAYGGGNFTARDGFSADFMLGFQSPRRDGVLAVLLRAQGMPSTGDMCTLNQFGACREPVPLFYSFAALFGRGWGGRSGLSARALTGPSVHHADGGATAVGLTARVDGEMRVVGPLGLNLALDVMGMPNYRGESVVLSALNLGLSIRP